MSLPDLAAMRRKVEYCQLRANNSFNRDWQRACPSYGEIKAILTALCSPEPECMCSPEINVVSRQCPIHGVAKSATTVADKGTEKLPRCIWFSHHKVTPTASAVDDTAEGPSGLKEGAPPPRCTHLRKDDKCALGKYPNGCPVPDYWPSDGLPEDLCEDYYPDSPPKSTNPGHTEPFHGTFQALAASLDVELWKAMDIARYTRLHPGHPDLQPLSNDIHTDKSSPLHTEDATSETCPDRSAQSEGLGDQDEDYELTLEQLKDLAADCARSLMLHDPNHEGARRILDSRVALPVNNRLEPDNICALCGQELPPQSSGFTTEFMLLALENQATLLQAEWHTPGGLEGAVNRTNTAIDKLREGK